MMICRSSWSKHWTKNLNKLLAVLLILALSMSVLAQTVRLSGATRTEHFLIRHDPEMKSTAQVIGQACEGWLAEIGDKLGLEEPPGSLIPVFLYRNQGEFKRGTDTESRGEVLGLASSRGYIELDVSGIFAPAEQVAGHEIVHIVIFRILGPNRSKLPLWMNEGMAKHLTNDFDAVDRTVLADAITKGRLIPLSSLEHSFPTGDAETLAYAEATSAVRYFVDSHGEAALGRLLHAIAHSGSFDAAMREVTGASADRFAARWLRHLEGKHGSPGLFKALSLIGSLALLAIGIGALLGIRRRRRRIAERYELDEWEEANWRDWGGGR
ncbi:MAG: hypothetical protein HYX78_14055 [Armatimonadetes bacterium]|nr:hypothetical protein [Armatimonadota bacterium]